MTRRPLPRPLLLPLVPLYAAGVALQSWLAGRASAVRLRSPVVSVGSLSAGGAGKTPFVIALGELLRRNGVAVDVLSRGHGRTSTETLRVDAAGDAAMFGDEPLLIARRLACAVYVARERVLAGRMAETDRSTLRQPAALHLLDDGFQHRRLHRTVDLVLLTAEDVADTLLPAGNLREPLRTLQRATVLVLRADEADLLRPMIASWFAGPVWVIERHFGFVEGSASARPLAFCGIARPDNFYRSLADAGVQPVDFVAGKDHQIYDDAAIAKLVQRAGASGADGFVTTAKDAVKLTAAHRRTLATIGPLAVGDVQVTLREETKCVAQLRAMLGSNL